MERYVADDAGTDPTRKFSTLHHRCLDVRYIRFIIRQWHIRFNGKGIPRRHLCQFEFSLLLRCTVIDDIYRPIDVFRLVDTRTDDDDQYLQ